MVPLGIFPTSPSVRRETHTTPTREVGTDDWAPALHAGRHRLESRTDRFFGLHKVDPISWTESVPNAPAHRLKHLHFLENLRSEARRRIWNEPADILRVAIMSEYADSLAKAFRQESPTIDFATMTISYGEEDFLIGFADGECRGWGEQDPEEGQSNPLPYTLFRIGGGNQVCTIVNRCVSWPR